MRKAFNAWKWSVGALARSYQTVVVLAVFVALWITAAYAWLGLPAESSVLLMVVSFVWAVVQIVAAVIVLGGIVAGAAETAVAAGDNFPPAAVWTTGRKKLLTTLVFCLAIAALAWLCNAAFEWANGHSVEVASFLTFRSEKPVSYEIIEVVFTVIERLVWIALGGFFLSFFICYVRVGWRETGRETLKLLASNIFRSPFLTNLLAVVVFGGLAYQLAMWHPLLRPGFWDYVQAIVRLSLMLVLLTAGALYWPLALARLQLSPREPS